MKKGYVKPALFYESFVLNQNIAACGIDVNYANERECTPSLDPEFWYGMSDTLFSDEAERCKMDISAVEAYCYTGGTTEAGRLFNS